MVPNTPDDSVVCDVTGLTKVDLELIDALARFALVLRRRGCSVVVRHACSRLRELLELAGLDAQVGLRLEPIRQAEQREEPGRVEEEDDPGEPIA